MRAWQVQEGGRLALADLPVPEAPPGGAVLRMQAAPMLSYLRGVLDGSLPYNLPPRPFIPGTNGIGVIEAVGAGVHHLRPGTRVVLDPRALADERVAEPAQILVGLHAMGANRSLQAQWPNGTYAEYACMPVSVLTPLPGSLDAVPAARLAAIGKFAVPYGGLLRAGLEPGETVVVSGATGYFGAAGAVLALALGAGRVVAMGRDRAALDALAEAAGPRLVPVALAGDDGDGRRVRDAADGGADVALDLVGRATSADATLAAIRALRRGGRLVLMGSMTVPLPLTYGEMLANDWQVSGHFMYPPDVPARIVRLIETGLLDLSSVRPRVFPLAELEAAMDAASRMRGLDVTVLDMAG